MKNKEELPLETLLKTYTRRFRQLGLPIPKQFDAKVREALDEDEELIQLHLWEELGPNAASVIFDSLKKANFTFLKSVRLWKTACGDEGARLLGEYLIFNPAVEILDLLNNGISPLGCEFLGRPLLAGGGALKRLTMDHNLIGAEGLSLLADGLRRSPNLVELSLSFCELPPEAATYLQQILLFHKSKLEILNLHGNRLGSTGFLQIIRALEPNEALLKLNVRDNQIAEEKPLVDQLITTLEKNPVLETLDLSFNGFRQETAEKILELETKKMQTRVEMDDHFEPAFCEKFNLLMAKIKPKKKKPKKAAKPKT